MEGNSEDNTVVAAAGAGDEAVFGALAERHRRELQVHCYPMLGSFEDGDSFSKSGSRARWC